MPWLPEVHALQVGIIRPLTLKKLPKLATHVWLIILIYVVEEIPFKRL